MAEVTKRHAVKLAILEKWSINDIKDALIKIKDSNALYEPCMSSINTIADYLIENGDAGFPEIDNDILQKVFVVMYLHGDDNTVNQMIDEMQQHEVFDLLMGDWEDMAQELMNKINNKN